jgi:hypothetical protein
MKKLLVGMVIGALALTACAQRGSDLGSPISAESGETSEEPSSGTTHRKKARSKSRNAAKKKAVAPVASVVPQQPMECSSATGGGDYFAYLTDVRVGTHEGYDRVVFEFAPPDNGSAAFGTPRYRLSRVTPPITEDGSGRPVEVDGAYHAGIVFHGGTGVEFTASDPKGYKLTYTGPREIKTGYRVLAETQETGDFEATLAWAFGLNRASCWRVSVLEDPLRVVVDFLH